MDEVKERLEGWLEGKFDLLYRDLCDAFPHPFEWYGLLERPRWWQINKRRAHNTVRMVFARHGIILTDLNACHYYKIRANHPQRFDEDCGGANVRQLRAAFGYAFIGPFIGLCDQS